VAPILLIFLRISIDNSVYTQLVCAGHTLRVQHGSAFAGVPVIVCKLKVSGTSFRGGRGQWGRPLSPPIGLKICFSASCLL